jgi:hypothetical protein
MYTIFWLEETEGKRPLARPRPRWKDNIIIDLTERELELVDWLHLAQVRDMGLALVNTVKNLRFPLILTFYASFLQIPSVS